MFEDFDELIKLDTSDDNSLAKALTDFRTKLETSEAKIKELEKAITDKECAINSLKASNFDLLTRVGKPQDNTETKPDKSIDEILKGIIENV